MMSEMINQLLEEHLVLALNNLRDDEPPLAAIALSPSSVSSAVLPAVAQNTKKEETLLLEPRDTTSHLDDAMSLGCTPPPAGELYDLSCSSSASTVLPAAISLAATTTTHLRPVEGNHNKEGEDGDNENEVLISAEHVARAVDYFVGLLPSTTTQKALAAARVSILQILTSLLEKGYTSMEHVICAMALADKLHHYHQRHHDEGAFEFDSMAAHEFPFLPSTSRRALIGLLRLVAKCHGDVYYRISDMLTAVDISVTGDLVGMTARCEWRLWDALGGNLQVSSEEYVAMVNFLEA